MEPENLPHDLKVILSSFSNGEWKDDYLWVCTRNTYPHSAKVELIWMPHLKGKIKAPWVYLEVTCERALYEHVIWATTTTFEIQRVLDKVLKDDV